MCELSARDTNRSITTILVTVVVGIMEADLQSIGDLSGSAGNLNHSRAPQVSNPKDDGNDSNIGLNAPGMDGGRTEFPYRSPTILVI